MVSYLGTTRMNSHILVQDMSFRIAEDLEMVETNMFPFLGSEATRVDSLRKRYEIIVPSCPTLFMESHIKMAHEQYGKRGTILYSMFPFQDSLNKCFVTHIKTIPPFLKRRESKMYGRGYKYPSNLRSSHISSLFKDPRKRDYF